jgi:hypothetical protein
MTPSQRLQVLFFNPEGIPKLPMPTAQMLELMAIVADVRKLETLLAPAKAVSAAYVALPVGVK